MQNDSILSVLEKLLNWLIGKNVTPDACLQYNAGQDPCWRPNLGGCRGTTMQCWEICDLSHGIALLLTFLLFLLVHLPNTFDYRRRLLIGTSRIFERKGTERVAKIDNQCFDAGASFRKRWR